MGRIVLKEAKKGEDGTEAGKQRGAQGRGGGGDQ